MDRHEREKIDRQRKIDRDRAYRRMVRLDDVIDAEFAKRNPDVDKIEALMAEQDGYHAEWARLAGVEHVTFTTV